MLGKNKGSKFYIAPDENVDVVKKLLKSWNNMDPEGMFEVLEDTSSHGGLQPKKNQLKLTKNLLKNTWNPMIQ